MASASESTGSLFRLCPGCGAGKIYRDDTHDLCIYCLHVEAHVISGCEICQSFPSGTRRDRARRVALRFATSTGKTTSSSLSSSSTTNEEGVSTEPPLKKRAIDQSAGGPRPTHKSSESPSQTSNKDPRLLTKPGSRWDVTHGERQPPSTVGVVPSPGTDTRRQGPSTAIPPCTTEVRPAPDRATPQASAQKDTSGHAPPERVTPLRLIVDASGVSPARSGDSPITAPPTPILHEPQPEAWQRSLDLAMGTIKAMVDQHQKSLRKVKSRLAEHQDAAKAASASESERFQTLLKQQQTMFQDEMRAFRQEADKRAAESAVRVRQELEELRRTCARPPPDPVAEMQQKELEALRKRQQQEKEETLIIDTDEEEEEEEEDGDGEAFPSDPYDDPYDPTDEPPTAPVDPLGDVPEPPVDDIGLPRSPTPRPAPLEDGLSFAALIQRAASHFKLDLEKTKPSDSYLLDKLSEPIKTMAALPIEPLVWDTGLIVMKAPASAPAVSSRIDKKYKVPSTAKTCFRAQISPESIISSSAKGASQVSVNLLAPPTKEARRMDNVGKKVLAAASAAVRAANYTAVLARYDREMWDTMSLALADLPPENREAANKVLDEGKLISNSLVRAALDSADCGFRQMNNGVWLRRQGWLSSSTFSQEYHPRILDLPFDGEHVFGPEVDKVLQEQKTFKETIKAMSPLTRGRGVFRGNRRAGRRGFGQAFPQQQLVQQASPQMQFQYSNPFPQNYPQQRGSGGGRQGGRPRRGGSGRGNSGKKQ